MASFTRAFCSWRMATKATVPAHEADDREHDHDFDERHAAVATVNHFQRRESVHSSYPFIPRGPSLEVLHPARHLQRRSLADPSFRANGAKVSPTHRSARLGVARRIQRTAVCGARAVVVGAVGQSGVEHHANGRARHTLVGRALLRASTTSTSTKSNTRNTAIYTQTAHAWVAP